MAPPQGTAAKRARTESALSSDGLQRQGSQLDSLLEMMEQPQRAGRSENRCDGVGLTVRTLDRVYGRQQSQQLDNPTRVTKRMHFRSSIIVCVLSSTQFSIHVSQGKCASYGSTPASVTYNSQDGV